ncbi:MAG TPA: type II secretion system protein N [Myxococcota bacterium]|nr:type II secretion system protein N [Myxococcota bacterium]
MRAVQLALGLACLGVIYAAVAPMVGAAALRPAHVPPIEAPPPRATTAAQYDVIAERNLFRSRVTAEAPTAEALKESQLHLKLCGTFASSTAERSVACIDDQTAQKRRAYRVNEEIADGVKLISVERRRAVIDNHGSREQLSMEETQAAGAILPGTPRPAPAQRPAATQKLSDRLKDLKEQQRLNDVVRPKLQDVLSSAQLAPVYDDSGQFNGVKLTNIRPGGAFTGMAENSVCFELNGNKLTGVQQLPQALLSMGNGESCLKCRQPDGTETTRCI